MPVTSRQQRYAHGTAVRDLRGDVSLTTSLPANEFHVLDALARKRGVSRSEVLRQAIREHIALNGRPP